LDFVLLPFFQEILLDPFFNLFLELHAEGVGRQAGYLLLFSPLPLPQVLQVFFPVFLSLRQVLQSTQPLLFPFPP
jgi:hypothetical protein